MSSPSPSSSSADLDSIFAVANKYRVKEEPKEATDRGLEKQVTTALHVAWRSWRLRTNQPTYDFQTGRCARERCRGRALNVSFYEATSPNTGTTISGFFAPVHICSRLFCELPAKDHRTRLNINFPPVFLCEIHAKIHCCDDNCQETCKDDMGNVTCVVSGLFKVGIGQFSFDDGTGRATTAETVLEKTETSEIDGANRLVDKQAIRKQKFTDRRTGIYAAVPVQEEFYSNDSRVVNHESHPLHARFVENPLDPIMWKDVLRLTALYWQAYDSVFLLLFSDQRNEIEWQKTENAHRRATSKSNSYANEHLREGEVMFVSIFNAVYRRELMRRYMFPIVLLPPEPAIARLCAYYALMVVEFHCQLHFLLDRLLASTKKITDVRMIEILKGQTFWAAAPNILDFFRVGFTDGALVVLSQDPFLQVFPESPTLKRLGYNEKTCTLIKTKMKWAMRFAKTQGMSLECMVGTVLDLNQVLRGDQEVIGLFAMARAKRLALTGAVKTLLECS